MTLRINGQEFAVIDNGTHYACLGIKSKTLPGLIRQMKKSTFLVRLVLGEPLRTIHLVITAREAR